MSVGSYLELYTTLLGWHQFANVWAVLSGIGLVFLPFIFIVVMGFVSARSPAEALRDVEIKIAFALSVVVLAAQPFVSLNPEVISYRPPCGDTEVGIGSTDTSYDGAMTAALEEVKVPIWWYGAMAIFSGAVRAAQAGLDCRVDLRKTLIQIDSSRIGDPRVLHEAMRFIQDCYIPARSTYYRTAQQPPEAEAILEKYGYGDPEWFGSHLYRELPGYYDRRRATVPVSGWPYDPNRDTEPDLDDVTGGRPYCKEWFEDESIGLRQKLLAQVDTSLLEDLKLNLAAVGSWFDDDAFDYEMAEDATIASLVRTSVAVSQNGQVFGTYTDAKGTTIRVPRLVGPINVTQAAAAAGTWWESLSFGPAMYAIRAGMPIIQALILLGIYMALPFGIVFANYSWQLVFTATLVILTIFFWSYLWHVAVWLENQLMVAIYATQEAALNAASFGSTDPNIGIKTRLLGMAVTLMFVGFPLLFSAVIGWAGFKIGGAVASVFDQSRNQFGQGGRAAADQAKPIVAGAGARHVGSAGNKK